MRTVVIVLASISAVALMYEFSWEKLAVCVAVTALVPLAIFGYGRKLAGRMDADKKAALEAVTLRKKLERQLEDLKRNNPWR